MHFRISPTCDSILFTAIIIISNLGFSSTQQCVHDGTKCPAGEYWAHNADCSCYYACTGDVTNATLRYCGDECFNEDYPEPAIFPCEPKQGGICVRCKITTNPPSTLTTEITTNPTSELTTEITTNPTSTLTTEVTTNPSSTLTTEVTTNPSSTLSTEVTSNPSSIMTTEVTTNPSSTVTSETTPAPTTPSPLCADPDRDYLAPYPGNCSLYVHCRFGEAFILECAADLKFDKNDLRCKVNADCDEPLPITTTPEPGFSCEIDQNPPSFYPHGSNCSLYYECLLGTIYPRKCSSGLYFDQVIDACNFANISRCHSECQSTGISYQAIRMPGCNFFQICRNGTAENFECQKVPTILMYNESSESCVVEYDCPYTWDKFFDFII